MPTNKPTTGNTLSGTHGFAAIRQHIVEAAQAMHPGSTTERKLNFDETDALVRVASRDVLGLLHDRGVEGADTLSGELQVATEGDGADLLIIGGRYNRQAEAAADVNDGAEQRRLGLLAEAAGSTAMSVTSSVMASDETAATIRQQIEVVRQMYVEGYTGASQEAVHQVLGGLLNESVAVLPGYTPEAVE